MNFRNPTGMSREWGVLINYISGQLKVKLIFTRAVGKFFLTFARSSPALLSGAVGARPSPSPSLEMQRM